MTKEELKIFFNEWKTLGLIYKGMGFVGNLHFPEPLQKAIITSFFDHNLQEDPSKTYDFIGNVELKSSTKKNGGCTPFSEQQTQCARILYMEIDDHITIYDIDSGDVQNINNLVSKGQTNISLSQYKQKSKVTQIV